jgi:4-carboxymuconolactone decarboxylase
MSETELFKRGLEIRKAVVGAEYVDKSIAAADSFNMPMQELVTEYCWGAVWGREDLPRKTRSMLNLAMISILNRPHELKLHINGALRNGVTKEEIREVFLQVLEKAQIKADSEEVEQDDAAACTDETCDIPKK